jgi:protein-disulfide isomerase
MGFNADTLLATMDSPEVKAAIEEDVRTGNAMLYRGGIPTIYVNGKVIPRWQIDNRPALEQILKEAAQN